MGGNQFSILNFYNSRLQIDCGHEKVMIKIAERAGTTIERSEGIYTRRP